MYSEALFFEKKIFINALKVVFLKRENNFDIFVVVYILPPGFIYSQSLMNKALDN